MKGLPRSLAHAKAGTELTPLRHRVAAKNLLLTVTGGASTAVGAGTVVFGGLPQGNILLLGVIGYLQFSSVAAAVAADWEGDFSLGTTADANATLSAGDIDIVASTEIPAATTKTSPLVRFTRTTAAVINNTDSDLEINLNVLTDDNDVTDSTAADFLVNGYVDLVYIVLGDD